MSKVIIVSGGTAGLGLDIAKRLAELGNQVIAFGLLEIGMPTEQTSENLMFKFADITHPDEIKALCEDVYQRFNRIDVIVNNAALGPLGTLEDTSIETWKNIHDVNLLGPFILAKIAVPFMKKNAHGSIINIGSGAGWGKPNMLAYATSKGGLITFNQALALDLFEENIRVNAVIPGGGGIVTKMSLERFHGQSEKLKEKAIGSVAGRSIDGADMANAINFLISDSAETITGTILDVGCFHQQGSSTPLRRA